MEGTWPVVLDGMSLQNFVQHVLDTYDGDTTLFIGGTKDDFLEDLRHPPPGYMSEASSSHAAAARASGLPSQFSARSPRQRASGMPTLRLLSASKAVQMTFCTDVTHLRAALSLHAQRPRNQDSAEVGRRLVALLNPIRLHRPTSAFCAQGVNRTLAIAVDAAHHTGSRLVIAECSPADSAPMEPSTDVTLDEDDAHPDARDAPIDIGDAPTVTPVSPSVWDEEVSILNVATKGFGAGERGWVGRTVKLRAVAERWCTFERPSDGSPHSS